MVGTARRADTLEQFGALAAASKFWSRPTESRFFKGVRYGYGAGVGVDRGTGVDLGVVVAAGVGVSMCLCKEGARSRRAN